MSDDAGRRAPLPGARRRGRLTLSSRTLSIAAALLVLGGGAAVAAGALTQEPPPPAPTSSPTADPTADPAPSAPAPAPATAAVPSAAPSAEAPTVPVPVEIRIPSIGVQSTLITVGLNADGTLAVPPRGPDYDAAAWYTGSPRPGAVGPAVIAGHVDGAGGPSVFHDLGALAPGALVEVSRADGSVVTFVVDAVGAYPKSAFPTLEVYANTTAPELRLITCGGDFDRATRHYVDNTVVFAHGSG